MPAPCATAELSLYRTDQQYRTVVGSAPRDVGVQLADDWLDECVGLCLQSAGDIDLPPDLRIPADQCDAWCRDHRPKPLDPSCLGPDVQACTWPLSYGKPGAETRCCPKTHTCCMRDEGYTNSLSLECCAPGETCCGGRCCPPGQTSCCNGECYSPLEQVCDAYGDLCPLGSVCGDQCCGAGSVCTPEGRCSPLCHGRVCGPDESCTRDDGCCKKDHANRSNTRCCATTPCNGEQCCGPGQGCCAGKICCGVEQGCMSENGVMKCV